MIVCRNSARMSELAASHVLKAHGAWFKQLPRSKYRINVSVSLLQYLRVHVYQLQLSSTIMLVWNNGCRKLRIRVVYLVNY